MHPALRPRVFVQAESRAVLAIVSRHESLRVLLAGDWINLFQVGQTSTLVDVARLQPTELSVKRASSPEYWVMKDLWPPHHRNGFT
jgi:uncharacterized protein YbcC (UPF0753/DUF2309 family)